MKLKHEVLLLSALLIALVLPARASVSPLQVEATPTNAAVKIWFFTYQTNDATYKSINLFFNNFALDFERTTNVSKLGSHILVVLGAKMDSAPRGLREKIQVSTLSALLTVSIGTGTYDETGSWDVPSDKLGLLALCTGLVSTILVVVVATALYLKRVKRRKDNRVRLNVSNRHKDMSRLYVGCGMCQGICPTSSVNFKISESLITVDFDYSRCTQCGVCIRACPALCNLYREKPKVSDVLGRIEKIYFGYSTDDSIRYHAASGGVITSLVLYMLKQRIVDKVLVTKMNGFIAEPILTGSRNQVLSAQGSIYFKTFSLRILKRILSDLEEGKRICVIGLPCQLSTLKKMLEDHQDKLYFLGLICGHTNEFWYLEHTVEKYLPGSAKPLAIGSRRNGWPGEIKVSFELHSNLRELAIPHFKFWGILPMLNISSPLGCLLCTDHLASSADIVTADAWHPKFAGIDSSGTSIIIARKPRGLKLIEEAIRDAVLYAEETSLQDLLIASPGPHLIESIHYAPLRRKLFQNRIEVLRELNEIDKCVILLLTILVMYLLKHRIARQLIVTSRIEKIFRLIHWFLSRKKYGKLSQISKNLDLNRRKSIDMVGSQK